MTVETDLIQERQETKREDDDSPARWWWKCADYLAWLLSQEGFDRGDLAELRRLDIEHPAAPAFWRLMHRRELLGESVSTRWERKWAVVFKGIALMTRNTPPVICAHNRDVPVGRALYGPGPQPRLSDAQLDRLLRLRGDKLYDALLKLCRTLRAARVSLNWGEMALLILYEGMNEQREKSARTRIARDYYRAEAEHKYSQSETEGQEER